MKRVTNRYRDYVQNNLNSRIRRTKWYKHNIFVSIFACTVVLLAFAFNARYRNISTAIPKLKAYKTCSLKLFAHTENEILSSSPQYNGITEMPVFKNRFYRDKYGKTISDINKDEMLEKVKWVANSLNLDINKMESSSQSVIAYCDGLEIEATYEEDIFLKFKPPIILPEQYLDFNSDLEENNMNTTKYLTDKYKNLLNMKSPYPELTGGDFNIYSERQFQLNVFENDGDMLNKILGYNFNRAKFYLDENKRLSKIYIHKVDISQKIGDYPILTVDDAKNIFVKDKFVKDVLKTSKVENCIKRIELGYNFEMIYRYETDLIIPYYKFLIEIPSETLKNNFKSYQYFYIPAVQPEYLEDESVWDIRVN